MNKEITLHTIATYDDKEYELQDLLNNLLNKLQRKDNNWNELKEFIENELNSNVDKEKSFGGYQCKIILDKIKELEGKNEKQN